MRTQYSATIDGTRITVEAQWDDAASPITYGLDGEEPDRRTVFRVADACHRQDEAVAMVSRWLDASHG